MFQQTLIRRDRCPECGSIEIVTDEEVGEITCVQCGLVLKQKILDQTPEWRAFTPEENKNRVRVGLPTSYLSYDKNLPTTFGIYKDTHGKPLSLKTRLKMRRLRRWDIRAKNRASTERNLSQAMSELDRLNIILNIPRAIREDAALIYRKALKMGLIRGRSIAAMAAASLYAACRLTGTPRRLKDIVKASIRSRKEIARCYRLIQRELDIKMPIDDPSRYISKIASKIGLNQKIQNKANHILRNIKREKHIVGKGPVGIAAVILYISAKLEGVKVTQKKLAEASGITEVTIRNRYKDIKKYYRL